MDEFKSSLFGISDILSIDDMLNFFDLIEDERAGFKIEKWGTTERYTQVYERKDAREKSIFGFDGNLYKCHKKHDILMVSRTGRNMYAYFTIYSKLKYYGERHLWVYREFMNLFDIDFGFIHYLNPAEVDFALLSDSTFERDSDVIISYHEISKYLPELYWITTFGSPYVEIMGREKLLNAPAYKIWENKFGGITIQLSESLMDCKNNFHHIVESRKVLKDYLGHEYFFQADLGINHSYKVPKLRVPQHENIYFLSLKPGPMTPYDLPEDWDNRKTK